MNSPETHFSAQGGAARPEVACDTCGNLFAPQRRWSRFCGDPCRNAFHGAERRKEAIRAAALDLFEVLTAARGAIRGAQVEQLWLNYPTEPCVTLGERIDQVLGKLKPPVEPKALLEKSKA